MRASYGKNDILRESFLKVETGLYDGCPPYPTLVLNWVGRKEIPPDRLLVASALAFGEYVSGSLDVGQSVSLEAASAARRYIPCSEVEFPSVDLRPRSPQPSGSRLLLWTDAEPEHRGSRESFLAPREYCVGLKSNTRMSGAVLSDQDLVLPTNAGLLGSVCRGGGVRSWGPLIAVAVLLATDFHAGEISVPERLRDESSSWWGCSGLLKAAGLSLSSYPA